MKSWPIHFAWAIVTVVACAITWRAAAAPPAAPVPVRTTAAVASLPVEARSEAAPASTSDDVPISAVIAAQAPTAPAPGTLAERIRALIKSSENWNDYNKLMKELTDRSLKLQLAKEAFASGNTTAMYWFMNELRVMKGHDVAEVLEDFLKAHPHDDEGSIATGALGDVGDPGSMAALTEALRSTHENTRFAAATSLRQLGFPAPAEQMLASVVRDFESPDGSIRRRAVERMTELDPKGALPILTRALKDSNGDVRLAAVQGLQSVEHLDYAPLITPLLNDPNPDVAKSVKDTLEALKNAEK